MGDWDDDELDDEVAGEASEPGAGDELDALDGIVADDGDGLPDEVRAELEAVAAAEGEMHDALEEALTEAQQALAAQREATRAALGRYREALLAAEPDLPPDMVAGETLEAVDASVAAARQTVARIRERMAASAVPGAAPSRGFPVGAPARGGHSTRGLTAAEKIAAGLSERRA